MKIRASFCDPFKPDIIDLGNIEADKIMDTFNNIPWAEYLTKIDIASDSEIYYSPSLEIENIENRNGLSLSAVDDTEWYIFFKRPKIVKSFFGLSKKMDENYTTEIHGQSIIDVKECLKAFIKNDLDFLENKIK